MTFLGFNLVRIVLESLLKLIEAYRSTFLRKGLGLASAIFLSFNRGKRKNWMVIRSYVAGVS